MSEFSEHRTWALVDDDGFLEDVLEGTPEQAFAEAGGDAAGVVIDTVYEMPGYPTDVPLAANPTALPMMPQKSLARSGIRRIDDAAVQRMSIEEAHGRLLPMLSRIERHGTEVEAYEDPEYLITEGLLRTNKKLMKPHPTRPTVIKGLSLAPNASAFQAAGMEAPPNPDQPEGQQDNRTFCVSSNEFCRATCLVYTGHPDPYNLRIKEALSLALLREPVAFCRMLVGATEYFTQMSECFHQDPYVRLNVYSDLPWELIYPELFERFQHVDLYDYTKVYGRRPPSNYTLTFSYSGTNKRQTVATLDDGGNAAVVFFLQRTKNRMPTSLWGHEVLDGTVHDVRPLDPPGAIVGLKYLSPNALSKLETGSSYAMQVHRFLVPCWIEDGEVVAAETPRHSGAFWFDFGAVPGLRRLAGRGPRGGRLRP
jgi:hypothetical protein